MFAINPRLRVLFPDLAYDLKHETVNGEGPIRWPDGVTLRVGRSHPAMPRLGLLTSGIWSMRVLTERTVHFSFADIVFRPLMWSLVPSNSDSERDGLGPQITKSMTDASEWVKYGPDRASVDLRNLTRTFPALLHPSLSSRSEWVELMTRDGSDAEPVLVFGQTR
ncbi:hypothetical protein [Kribbella sp. CA-294648]|uniref:hypothetical protein n=1 Tax=Kribbella sp. CA-294648 TaxID=3239948 RepID=UPI003D89C760